MKVLKFLRLLLVLITIGCVVITGVTSYKYQDIMKHLDSLQKTSFEHFFTSLERLHELTNKIIDDPENENLYRQFNIQLGYIDRSFYAFLDNKMVIEGLSDLEILELQKLFTLLFDQVRYDIKGKSINELKSIYIEVDKIITSFEKYKN